MTAVLVATGCIHIPAEEPVWGIDRGVQQSTDPRLSALADQIDPGPQAPLRSRMRAGLLVGVDGVDEGDDPHYSAEQRLRATLLMWREAGAIDGSTLTEVARAVARAEGLKGVKYPELQVTLIDAYAALDERAEDAARMLAQPGQDVAGALLRRTAAELLRSHASHPQLPAVMELVGAAARRRGDFARAAELLQLHALWLGEGVSTEQLRALAAACYRALTPVCGDVAAVRVRERGENIDELQRLAQQAGRVSGPMPADVDGQLERAERLLALGRAREASEIYARATATAPRDARPRVGLARLALLRGEVGVAQRELAAAKGLERRDRHYFELVIALRWPALRGGADAAALAELRGLADGYARFDPARAQVLATLLRAQADGGAAMAGSEQPKIARLLLEFPGSADVRRLAYVAAQVAPTAEAALRLVRAELPPELGELAGLRAATWFDVALRWDVRAELPAIVSAIGALPEAARGELWATALAARAALAQEEQPPVVTTYFTQLVESGAPEERGRAYNNLAVMGRGEDPQRAVDRWVAALELGFEQDVVRLNMARMLAGAEQLKVLESLTEETSEVGMLALAWRVAQIEPVEGARRERAALASRLQNFKRDNPGAGLPGQWGMVAAAPQMRLEVDDDRLHGAEVGGLRLTAEVQRRYWLVERVDLGAALERPKKTASVASARTSDPK